MKYNKLWELESLCILKAIEKANSIDKNKLLFINVNPAVLKEDRFKRNFATDFLAKNKVPPESIIFEITDKTDIEDYKSFVLSIKNYTDRGYKIAIDNTGSNHSGLRTLVETKPHFLKLDIELVRNIENDTFKQALIKMLVALCSSTNLQLIAEGIETNEELKTLISLGVYAGQGFFLQRPSETFTDIDEPTSQLIIKYNRQLANSFITNKNYVGEIANVEKTFTSDVKCSKLKEHFKATGAKGACIVEDDAPIGIVMESSLNAFLGTQFGYSVFYGRPVSLVMNPKPLIVDYNTPISEVSFDAMRRDEDEIYDYVIVSKEGKYYGIVTIKTLIEQTTMLEKTYAQQLNPLTGLPGNIIIDSVMKNLLEHKRNSCVLYFDLDNFKVYNDTYGFENGDRIITYASDLIQSVVKEFVPYNSFVGHIGGDDFVSIFEANYKDCVALCTKITQSFDKNVLDYFNEEDARNGYIVAVDRKGNKDTFPLTSISIAGMFGNFHKFTHTEEITVHITSIKKAAKAIKHSSYVIENINEQNE